MKIMFYMLLLMSAFIGVLTSCSSSTTENSAPVSTSAGSVASSSNQVFSEVNSYRASKGDSTLERHAGLDRLAQQHCNYLVKNAGKQGLYGKYVSHFGFEGRAEMARYQYNIMKLGENVVASSNGSSKHLIKLWCESKSHEQNMRGDWICTGVATAVTPQGIVICTQLFGSAPSAAWMKKAGDISR